MKVRLTLEALDHIAAIQLYVQSRSPHAAARIVERIFAELDRLGDFPQLGHIGSVPGTYEWTPPGLPYVMVHEPDETGNEIIILGVFHGAQDR